MLIEFLRAIYRYLIGFVVLAIPVEGFATGVVLGILLNHNLFGGEYTILPEIMGFVGVVLAFIAVAVLIPPIIMLFYVDARVKDIEKKLKEKGIPQTSTRESSRTLEPIEDSSSLSP